MLPGAGTSGKSQKDCAPKHPQPCPPGAKQGWVKLPQAGRVGVAPQADLGLRIWHWWKEAAAFNPPVWKICLGSETGLQNFHLLFQPPQVTPSRAGHKVQMQHKYSVRCSPALPPSGTWKRKSFQNKTQHTPALPEPSPTFSTKLLEAFSVPCGAIWGLYLSCNQPSTGWAASTKWVSTNFISFSVRSRSVQS